MRLMDALLLEDALKSLQALNLIASSPSRDGFLLGHKRGPRFYIEKIFLSQKGFFSSIEQFFRLNRMFDGRIIGFFSFGADEKRIKKILSPHGFQKLLLTIRSNRRRPMTFKPYVIDFDSRFFLSKIALTLPAGDHNEK